LYVVAGSADFKVAHTSFTCDIHEVGAETAAADTGAAAGAGGEALGSSKDRARDMETEGKPKEGRGRAIVRTYEMFIRRK